MSTKPEQWEEAKRRCRLSDDDIRKAKELGMQPRSLIKNIPSPSQQWKAPVRDWVRMLHARKFGDRAAREPKITLFDRADGFLVRPPRVEDAKPAIVIERRPDEDISDDDVPF